MRQYFDGFYMTDDKSVILNKCIEVNDLLRKAYWAKDRDVAVMHNAIVNSLNYAIFETNSEMPVGFARVVTDYSTVYYISDVYVDEKFRGIGLGKKLVNWIVFHEEKLKGIN